MGLDLDLDPIPIIIGSIPHKVAFPTFEAAPETDDNDGGPTENSNSPIVALPKHLVEKLPGLPGVLRSDATAAWRFHDDKKRWVKYVEYSCKDQAGAKQKNKKK